MLVKRFLAASALSLILCLGIGVFTSAANAQAMTNGGDTKAQGTSDDNLAGKKTIGDSLSTREKEEEVRGPTRFQMGVGVGSTFVMYIVVKWL